MQPPAAGATASGFWAWAWPPHLSLLPHAGVKARLRLDADGGFTVSTAGHEMGMGTATVQAQHAADRLA